MIHLIRTGACIGAAASALALGFAFWPHEAKVGPASVHAAVMQPEFVATRAITIEPHSAPAAPSAAPAPANATTVVAKSPDAETAAMALAKLASALRSGAKPEPTRALAFADPLGGSLPASAAIRAATLTTASAPASAPAAPASASDAARQLCSRGLLALADGDIAGARRLLQRAADAGDTRAWVLLGAAYDPATLQRMNVRGAKGDSALARQYYSRAIAAGMSDAKGRMAALEASSD